MKLEVIITHMKEIKLNERKSRVKKDNSYSREIQELRSSDLEGFSGLLRTVREDLEAGVPNKAAVQSKERSQKQEKV
jgi:hypothetical protein